MLNWDVIDTLLLDMDGTLLDLHFDNHFWREFVPQRYADSRGISVADAKVDLIARYQAVEGSMQWYCVDYWSEQLGLDIPLLKEEVDHLIVIHPHVPEFLAAIRDIGKRLVLVTNAHGKSLNLKMERTQLGGHFDAIVCAHDLGLPKENPNFWERLKTVEPFEAGKTLLIDDSLPVLRSARADGIGFLLAVLRPDSKLPLREILEFPAIKHFTEIMPATAQ